MNIEKFFKRIGFTRTPKVDYYTLAELQTKFLLSVPFENLDMHYGDGVAFGIEAAYDKIVERNRGGYCYECNSLMYAMLCELGFRVDLYSGRMTIDGPMDGPEFGHMFLKVTIDRDYLVDVGNGQSFRTPLYEDGSNEAWIPEGFTFRVGPHIDGRTVYSRSKDTRWNSRFNYDPIARDINQFLCGREYHHTSPDSPFPKGPLATLATPHGRIFVTPKHFVELRHGEKQEIPLANESEFLECLKTKFNLVLGSK